MAELDGSSILLTGGTGSFGKAFISYALAELNPRRLVVLSRDELKQYEVRQQFDDDPRLRWFIGDVRDRRRLERAMHGVDYVVHAAALKQVDTGEYNPFEFVQTNVVGSQNVIEAAIDSGVKKVVALSTDKASSPINLYGATKLCADRMFISANHYAAAHPTRFAVVRYGNVMASRGSVIPLFRSLAEQGKSLPITHKEMTRFTPAIATARLSPALPLPRIDTIDIRTNPVSEPRAFGLTPRLFRWIPQPSLDADEVGLANGDRYIVQPHIAGWGYEPPEEGTPVPEGFSYRSDTNDLWLSTDDIKKLIAEHE